MPPKRKAAAAKKKAPAKKAKVEEEEEEAGPSDIKKTIEALKKGDKGKTTHKVDSSCRLSGSGSVSIVLLDTCLVPSYRHILH